MPYYMSQFSYTTEAWQNLVARPEDRKKAVSKLMKKVGGRLIDMYLTMGDYDGVLITEAPDDESAAAAILAAVAAGHVATVKTTKLFTMGEAMKMMQRAGEVSYRPPKGT